MAAASEAIPDAALRARFDTWLAAAVARFMPPLTFREIRKGVQALSSLYVERREGADLSQRAVVGEGKRAAFVTYYAPLHFLTAFHAARDAASRGLPAPRRLLDLGCGSGAAGAGAACALSDGVAAVGVDRSGYLLSEARHTYAAFGVRGKTRRGALPQALPPQRPGDCIVSGWFANELPERARAGLLDALLRRVADGSTLLMLEPLAGPVSPWWPEWSEAFDALGVRDATLRVELERPDWIAQLDLATGLDHRSLGARVLAGPLPLTAPIP